MSLASVANRPTSIGNALLNLCKYGLRYVDVPAEVEVFRNAVDTLQEHSQTLNNVCQARASYLDSELKHNVEEAIERAEFLLREIQKAISDCQLDLITQDTVTAEQRLQCMVYNQNSAPLNAYIQTLITQITSLREVPMAQIPLDPPPSYESLHPQHKVEAPSARRKRFRPPSRSGDFAQDVGASHSAMGKESDLLTGQAPHSVNSNSSNNQGHALYELPVNVERTRSVSPIAGASKAQGRPSELPSSCGSTNVRPVRDQKEVFAPVIQTPSNHSGMSPRQYSTLPEVVGNADTTQIEDHSRVEGGGTHTGSFVASALPVSIGIAPSQSYQSWYTTREPSNATVSSINTTPLTHSTSVGARAQAVNQSRRPHAMSWDGSGSTGQAIPLTHSVSLNTGSTDVYPAWSPPQPPGTNVFQGQPQPHKKRYKAGYI